MKSTKIAMAIYQATVTGTRQRTLIRGLTERCNPEDAKEICQEALIKIYRYLRSFKKGRSFKNWVYKTAVNTARDFLKKQKRFDLLMEQQKTMHMTEMIIS